ncbi:lipoprotein [Actinoplanes sp. NPDC051494]|uniref:lipoprotein n=1 Tax=Actinoplanes sp. NPDC051494 TaxID=3363907 RepID=UPI00379DBA66
MKTATIAASLLLLAGCSAGPAEPTAAATAGATTLPAARVGADGSACTLPVEFDLATRWKPAAVDAAAAGELADLFRSGPFTMLCEISAKPAGSIGFLRVYVAAGRTGTPRSHLETFVAGQFPDQRRAGNFEVVKSGYAEVTTGGQAAAEVTYETWNTSMEHAGKYSAFAVNTAGGAVVVHLSAFGADEHDETLPALRLAERTLTVTP